MRVITTILLLLYITIGTRAEKPNIIFILADDLGYGDLGCYGQAKIKTPRLDRMAAEGLRFTRFYAGATVCAPSRCVLMTGKHTGHARVRANADPQRQSLTADDTTVAAVLQRSGYRTALIGKWGLGQEGTPGLPNDHGFEHFFGYLNQHHAHNFYPEFLWRNETIHWLDNQVERIEGRDFNSIGFRGGFATKRVQYSHDLFVEDALAWIETNQAKPFFLFLSLTIPHANNEAGDKGMEVPELGAYADTDWPDPEKGKAAMITRMDHDVGRVLDKLGELGIAQKTLVIFTSDNGPHREGGSKPDFFDSNGPLRGIKRDLYEGGIRVPTIAWRPGTIKPGRTTDHIAYFGDFFATACELAGIDAPAGLDSVSLVPTLTGRPDAQRPRDMLYWEFHERKGARAIVAGNWKAVRPTWHAPLELYNLEEDIGETNDRAADYPEIVERMAAAMEREHTPDANWVPPRKE